LINGPAGKFLASIIALILSITFTLIEKKVCERQLSNGYEHLVRRCKETLPLLSQSRILLDIERLLGGQAAPARIPETSRQAREGRPAVARGSGSDHLAHPFTDLVTSLMVIFVLLLLLFVNNQASVNVSATQALVAEIRQRLDPSGFRPDSIHLDARAPFTIALCIPSERLKFAPGSHQVKPDARLFLLRETPKVAAVLCEETFGDSVESIVVEGYSDSTPYRGVTPPQSEALNMQLSQARSMEVARIALSCPTPSPSVMKVLPLLEQLCATPRQQVSFHITESGLNEYLAFTLRSTPGPELSR
jgi:flagellar motor protein MotB